MNGQFLRESEPKSNTSDSVAQRRPHGSSCSICKKKHLLQQSRNNAKDGIAFHPSIVQEALSSPGQLLDNEIRAEMGQRFKHDFSQVRVHTDSKAAQSARVENALAYTVGQDVVFGDGQYKLFTSRGQSLLQHELIHTIHQARGITSGLQREAGASSTRPASSAEGAEFLREQRNFIRSSIESIQLGGNTYLLRGQIDEPGLRRQLEGWQRIVESSLSTIHSSLNDDAALTNELRQAYENAVRALISSASRQLHRTSHDLYQSYRSIIHEWAWPQASVDAGGSALSDALSMTERQNISIVTSSDVLVQVSSVDSLFSTSVAVTTIPLPSNVTVRFGGSIPSTLERGLQNVAGELAQGTLRVNTTVTVALDLGRYGGDYSAYRFTFVQHPARRGQASMREILIEHIGRIGVEGLSRSQEQATLEKFNRHGFSRGQNWSDAQFVSVLEAINAIPDSMLSPVDGLSFNREHVHSTDPNAGGTYDPATHVITVYDRAFGQTIERTGVPGTNFSNESTRSIRHEIGHAVDLLPLRQVWVQLNQTEGTIRSAFSQFESPPGSGHFDFPGTEQAHWDELQQRLTAAQQARNAARSRSEHRWQQRPSGEWVSAQGSAAAGSNAFRQAAMRDGGRRLTNYSNREWQEYFAEAYSVYISDPATLSRLRRNVYDYFVRELPR